MKSRTEFEEQKRLAWDLQNRIEDVMFQNVVDGHKLEALYPDVYRNVHEYGMGIDIAKAQFEDRTYAFRLLASSSSPNHPCRTRGTRGFKVQDGVGIAGFIEAEDVLSELPFSTLSMRYRNPDNGDDDRWCSEATATGVGRPQTTTASRRQWRRWRRDWWEEAVHATVASWRQWRRRMQAGERCVAPRRCEAASEQKRKETASEQRRRLATVSEQRRRLAIE
ncbi:hypothetical protein Syun_030722 [Stephania yunnanensis]|uniref:Uncharacterized protein n=1 Tax=Stephania yunnanensis TaxID=152371 RepID=A0AAP0HGH1_9MAGN